MSEQDILKSLQESMIELNEQKAIDLVKKALSQKFDPFSIMNILSDGMKVIGEGFACGERYIPELVKSGEIFKSVNEIIEPELRGKRPGKDRGQVVVGTVKGDLHDLGLRLVSLTLFIDGFNVTNLGINVPTETFIDKVKELKPHILGLSALLTTTLIEQKEVIEALKAQGLRDKVKVMVGGAPVTQEWTDSIGADAVGFDAIDAVEKARALIEPKTV